MDDQTRAQFDVLRQICAVLSPLRVRFWLRGGWAVDFLLGEITRTHADIDLVIWLRHGRRVHRALREAGFILARETEAQSDFRANDQDVSVVYLTRGRDGHVVTHGIPEWIWPADALPLQRRSLKGLSAFVVGARRLLWEKESYERGTGRPLRPKDQESMEILRSVLAARSSPVR